MVSPRELAEAVASVTGIPAPTVVAYDRNLAIAGLRTTGGRGRSGPDMTPRDAAALLIALSGSTQVKDAVSAFETYAPLLSRSYAPQARASDEDGASGRWDLSELPIPELQALPANHSFHDALSALIEASANGSYMRAIEKAREKVQANKRLWVPVWGPQISVIGPHPQVVFRIMGHRFSEDHAYRPENVFDRYPEADHLQIKEDNKKTIAKYGNGDLTQIREFTGVTIQAIGELFKGYDNET